MGVVGNMGHVNAYSCDCVLMYGTSSQCEATVLPKAIVTSCSVTATLGAAVLNQVAGKDWHGNGRLRWAGMGVGNSRRHARGVVEASHGMRRSGYCKGWQCDMNRLVAQRQSRTVAPLPDGWLRDPCSGHGGRRRAA